MTVPLRRSDWRIVCVTIGAQRPAAHSCKSCVNALAAPRPMFPPSSHPARPKLLAATSWLCLPDGVKAVHQCTLRIITTDTHSGPAGMQDTSSTVQHCQTHRSNTTCKAPQQCRCSPDISAAAAAPTRPLINMSTPKSCSSLSQCAPLPALHCQCSTLQ